MKLLGPSPPHPTTDDVSGLGSINPTTSLPRMELFQDCHGAEWAWIQDEIRWPEIGHPVSMA